MYILFAKKVYTFYVKSIMFFDEKYILFLWKVYIFSIKGIIVLFEGYNLSMKKVVSDPEKCKLFSTCLQHAAASARWNF